MNRDNNESVGVRFHFEEDKNTHTPSKYFYQSVKIDRIVLFSTHSDNVDAYELAVVAIEHTSVPVMRYKIY